MILNTLETLIILKILKNLKAQLKMECCLEMRALTDISQKMFQQQGKHDEIIEEWVYDKAYQDVQLFDECDRDIKKLRNNLIKSNPSWTSEMIDEAIEEVVSRSNKFDKLIKGAKTKKKYEIL